MPLETLSALVAPSTGSLFSGVSVFLVSTFASKVQNATNLSSDQHPWRQYLCLASRLVPAKSLQMCVVAGALQDSFESC